MDTITVEVHVEETVDANGADLLVTVRGSSLVTGRAALKKAREVRALVEALAGHGIGDEDIRIEGIRASVSSGLITKTSSATFDLRIACDELDQLGDLVGVITSQKQADMTGIEWRFPQRHELDKQLLARAVPQAREKAELIASLLGVELLGVHDLHEGGRKAQPRAYPAARTAADMPMRARKSMSSEELGLEVSHSETFEMELEASFRVGPLAT